ncbi:MAG: ATP-binding protein [Chlorobi bacterium]|nr:ATP-binding protein [Chlorobiota bacterium]
MKKRLLYYTIIKQLEHKNALVITGMRQVGKTTLMKQIFSEIDELKIWYDLENPLDQLVFEEKDFNVIYNRLIREANGEKGKRLFVFIDEIQNYPEITRIMKYLIDYYGVKFLVTGSSNFYLRNLFPESLSGRKFLYILLPMDFREILYFQNKISLEYVSQPRQLNKIKNNQIDHEKRIEDYRSFLEFGGFPEVVTTEDNETKKLILKNIFTSFFEKDLQLLSDIRNVRELRDLILLLVPRTGNILDISKIAAELGVQRTKIYNYMEFLTGIFLIALIPRFSQSIDRSVAGGRKVYFADTGLLNLIGKVNEGQLFENAVANQLKHYGELQYYNKRNTAEIDFILNKETAVEVKLNGTVRDLEKLKYLSEKIGLKKQYLISRRFLPQSLSPVLL